MTGSCDFQKAGAKIIETPMLHVFRFPSLLREESLGQEGLSGFTTQGPFKP